MWLVYAFAMIALGGLGGLLIDICEDALKRQALRLRHGLLLAAGIVCLCLCGWAVVLFMTEVASHAAPV